MSSQQQRNIVKSEAQSLPGLLLAAQQLARIATVQEGHDNLGFDGSVTQTLTITLTKEPGEALGFSVSEYPSTTGVFVATVVEESAAFENGLRTNDQILLVNEENVSQADRFTATAIFRSLPAGEVQIKVLRSTQVNLRKTLQQHIHALHNSDGKYLPELIREQSADESTNGSTISADDINRIDVPHGTSTTQPTKLTVIPTNKVEVSVAKPNADGNQRGRNRNGEPKTEGPAERPLSLAEQWVNQRARFNSLAMRNELFARPDSAFGHQTFNAIFAAEILLGSVIIILECISMCLKKNIMVL
ncbi:hypothetical protein RvY_18658-2 [Ramazzottius varieornatus]|uniref:PDZ domain-containing protein n=1 Tax=Ramazzottius varieornatus TaxID=947166 RepID=A0A1D1WBK2_RAMVA|nr:hypothetical protein RvY_18658-2 [Ramazzottius varieornatus]